eukprot:gene7084-9668_t
MIKYGLIVPFSYANNNNNNNNEVTEYLVPSILPPIPEKVFLQNEEEWDHIGYFVFTTDYKLSNQDFISKLELKMKGFLPKGLFERLVCKAITWCHYKISIKGSNPLPVINRAHDLIVKLTEECMKNLHCFKVLSYNINNSIGKIGSSHDLFVEDDSVVMIPLLRLHGIVLDDLNQPPLSLPYEKSLMKNEILALYGCWIKLRGPKDIYDNFISYRWGNNDSRFVKALFDSLSNYHNVDSIQHRSVDVFLDTNRLEDGKHLQQSFISALINSYVITPIISKDALQRLIHHKPDEIDNVLVEWITALEVLNIQNNNNNNNNNNNKIRLARIFPIMFGNVSDDGRLIEDLFKDGILNKISESIPISSVSMVVQLMTEHGLQPRSNISQRSVKSFIEELLKFMGYPAWITPINNSLHEICANKIIDVIQQVINIIKPINKNLELNYSSNIISNSSLSNIIDDSSFNIQEWLLKLGLEGYYEQFISSGIDKKVHLIELKSEAGDKWSVLKENLIEFGVQIKPMHAKTLFEALNNLN